MSWVLGEQDVFYYGNDRCFLNGDTTIEGTTYTKVYFERSAHTEFPDTALSIYLGGLRTSSSQVYYKGVLDSSNANTVDQLDSVPGEILLYDFDALPGDSILHLVNYRVQSGALRIDSVYSIVSSLDGITTPFGNVRSYSADRLISSFWNSNHDINYFDSYVAYEAYGDNRLGLFGPLKFTFESGCQLFCFNSPDYSFDWDSYASCDNVGIDDMEDQNKNCLTFSQNLIISSCASSNSVISVYDMTGKLILTENYTVGGFDCASLKGGIYLTVVQSETEKSVLKFAITR